MILVHELGHALAGWLVGYRVLAITFGDGPKLRGRIGDLELTLGLLPFTGRTSVHAVHTRGYRWRTAVVSVGGVTANVAAAAAVMMLPAPALVRGLVVVLTAMVVVGNLWPIDLAVTSAGLGPSDGSQLRDALRIEPDAVPTQVALYRLATASILARRGEHRRADAEVEAARALGLNEESIMPISAYLLLERGDYPAASEMFSRVTHLSRPPEHWAYDVNGFAWSELMRGEQGDLDMALEAAQVAHEALGWNVTIGHTYGFALVMAGRVAEGREHLVRARRDLPDRRAKADVQCTIAIADARLGALGDAGRAVIRARELDPGSPLLPRAEAEVRKAVDARRQAEAATSSQ